MKRLLYILLFVPFLGGATDYFPIDQSSLQTYITNAAAGDRILVNDVIATTAEFSWTSSGADGNPIEILSENGSKITALKTLTGAVDQGGNIWKFANASTLDSLNIVLIDGVNTEMGRSPNFPNFYPVLYSNVINDKSTSLRLIDFDGLTDYVGGKIHRKSSFRKVIATINSQVSNEVVISHPITAVNIDSFGCVITDHINVLDVVNEWFYDRATGDLYVVAESEPTGVQIPTVDDLFDMQGSYVTFKDITIEGANSYLFNNNKGATTYTDLSFENVELSNAGRTAIFLRYDYLSMDECLIDECNDAGLQPSNTENITVTNTEIRNIGLLYSMLPYGGSGWGVNHIDPEGINLYQYNYIHHTGYANWMTDPDFSDPNVEMYFKNNLCTYSCNVFSDGGNVYMYSGTKALVDFLILEITDNILLYAMDGSMAQPVAPTIPVPTSPLYLDEYTGNVTIEGNLMMGGSTGGMFFNLPDKNIAARNNTIAYGGDYATRINNISGFPSTNIEMTNNIIVSTTDYSIEDSWDAANYDELNQDFNTYVRTESIPFEVRNVKPTLVLRTFAEWQSWSGKDANSTLSVVEDVDIRYNATKTNSVVQFSGYRWIDAKGVVYTESMTILPYDNVVIVSKEAIQSSPNGRIGGFNGGVLWFNGKVVKIK